VKLSTDAYAPRHGDSHTSPRISSLLRGTHSTDALSQISQMLNVEKGEDQLYADLQTATVKNIINIDIYYHITSSFLQVKLILKVVFFLKNPKKQKRKCF